MGKVVETARATWGMSGRFSLMMVKRADDDLAMMVGVAGID